MTHTHGEKRIRLEQLVALEQAVYQRLWPEWQSAYAQVQERLMRVVRASSAVECLNSVVRMHQERHRHVSQGLDHGVGHPSDSCPRWKHLTH
jgi:hypothetical protein